MQKCNNNIERRTHLKRRKLKQQHDLKIRRRRAIIFHFEKFSNFHA